MHVRHRPTLHAGLIVTAGLHWLVAAGAAAQSAPTPAPAAPATEPAVADRWEADVAAYEAEDRTAPPKPGGICLIGSSNVRLWTTLETDFPGMHVINRGVGGCRLAELADFAPRLVSAARPRAIVVSAGTNDVNAGASAEELRDTFARLVATIRKDLPDATIAFLAIAPSIRRWDQVERQREANEAIRGFVAESGDPRLRFLDANAAFLGPDGQPDPACFVEDLQHPSVEGNARRAAILRPLFAELGGTD